MPVVIEKEELLKALDDGKVRFIAEGDLTPEDVYEVLQVNADRLEDSIEKKEIKLGDLFDQEPQKVSVHKSFKSAHHTFSRVKE